MEITNQWLKEQNACSSGYKWALSRNYTDTFKTIQELTLISKFDWANWVIVRLMTKEQKIQYAIFAAESVLYIWEKRYPKDDRLRKAIEAAKNVLKENTADAATAAAAATYAAYAAYAADAAAYAAYAADAATDAAAAATYAAYAAYAAATYAAYAAATYAADAAAAAAAAAATYAAYAAYAADAAAAAKKEIQIKILNYGLELLQITNRL